MTSARALISRSIDLDLQVAHEEGERPEYIAILVAQKLCAHMHIEVVNHTKRHVGYICLDCDASTTHEIIRH